MDTQNKLHSVSLDLPNTDLTRFQRSAAYSGQNFDSWAKSVLTQASDRILAFEDHQVEERFPIPEWAAGLSVRTVKVLLLAGVNSKDSLIKWFNENSATDIKSYPNSGNYVYNELCIWMKA